MGRRLASPSLLAFLALFLSLSLVPPTQAAQVVVPYAATGDGWWTGVAVTNLNIPPGLATGSIRVDFYRTNGTLLGSSTIGTLAGKAAYVDLASNIFDGDLPTRYWMVFSHPGQAQIGVTVFVGNGADGFSYHPFRSDAQPAGIPIASLPFTITHPGTYYVTQNLTSTANGILIQASDVTLDLKGFTCTGPGTTGNTLYGIVISGAGDYNNVTIKNGTVRQFGSWGLRQPGTDSYGHRLENMRFVDNGNSGAELWGKEVQITNCAALNNGGEGFRIGNGIVTHNVARDNAEYGFHFTGYTGSDGGASVVAHNFAASNGKDGIACGYGSTVTHNTATLNQGSGIATRGPATIIGNMAYKNQEHGIDPGSASLVDQNAASDNNQADGGYDNIDGCSSCTFGSNSNPAP